jgi:hypothetical protein
MAESLFIPSPLLARHGITALFSLRHGGISQPPFDSLNLGHKLGDEAAHVRENLERLCRAAAAPQPHRSEQVHGCDLLDCHGRGRQHATPADILLTREPGCAVAVRTADCLPILLAAPVQGIVSAVHAGWRGTAMQVVRTAIQAMTRHGADPAAIVATLGPCIGPCCFEVGPEVAEALVEKQPNAAIGPEKNGHFYPDLAAINRQQLLEAGLLPGHIETINACTSCDPERFFSHRRDAGHTGRHLAVVALPSAT